MGPNRFMAQAQAPLQPAPATAGTSPQGAPPAMPPPIVTPEQIETARKHANAMVDGLVALTSQPRGTLTKKRVFDEAADMLAKGAFPTPGAKQALIVEMANMPDSDAAIRQALAQHLVVVSAQRAQLYKVHGPGNSTGGR